MIKGVFVLFRKLPFRYSAITIFPFVFYTGKLPEWLINHERIHLQQQIELLVLPFYIWYLSEFLIRLLVTRNWSAAYRSICFEREAYSHHHDPAYLANRKAWNFIRYMKKPGK